MGGLELALYGLCWAAVFLVGGVHAPVQLALAAGALGLVLALGLGRLRTEGLRMPPLAWVMLAAIGWTALSCVPLPLGLLSHLNPAAAALREETGAASAPITLDVAHTTLELAKQLAYLGAFLVGVELLRARQATRRAASALAVLGVALAASIAAHRGLHAARFFGVYAPQGHPGSGYFAPFVNGNHAASVLALCALCAFGLAAATERGARLAWLGAGAATAAALFATMSRGAALGLMLGGFVLGGTLAIARFGRVRGLVLSGAVLIMLGGGALVLADGLRTRLSDHSGEQSWTSNQKTRAWRVALRLGERFPLTGVGRGAFEAPAAALRVESEGIRLNYAEDFVLQAVSEWGWPVAVALLVAAAMALAAAVRRLPREPELAGILGGAVAVIFYGLLDCGFEIPGVMLPLVLALAALIARAESEQRGRRRPRPRAKVAALALGGVAALAVLACGLRVEGHTLDADADAVRAAIHAGRPPSGEALAAIVARHPAAADLEMLAGEVALARGDQAALHHLGRAMRLQPSAPRPHELAAIELLRLRRPAQAALEYRMAIERGAPITEVELCRWLGPEAVDAVPRTVPSLLRVAGVLAAMRRWPDADAAFARAAELGGGAEVRTARVGALAQAPAERRQAAADELARQAQDGDELAAAVGAFVALGQLDRADELTKQGSARYPTSAALVAAAARARAQRGDLDGARALVAKIGRFDARGRLLLAELAVELAQKAGDLDGAASAQARLRLLRAKVDLEQPSARATPK